MSLREMQVNIKHTTWVRYGNGATIPNNILTSVQDEAEERMHDIIAEFKGSFADPNKLVQYHYSYDEEEWHDEDGYKLCHDGEWREDPGWEWPAHLTTDGQDDGTPRTTAGA